LSIKEKFRGLRLLESGRRCLWKNSREKGDHDRGKA